MKRMRSLKWYEGWRIGPLLAVGTLSILCLVSCQSGVAQVSPAPTKSTSPSAIATTMPVPSPSPRPSPAVNSLSLTAIERISTNVGFVSGSAGNAFLLAETTDGGTTWRRVRFPANYISALRFTDAKIGWAGAFALRTGMPGVGCMAAPPPRVRVGPCLGLVLRTTDGGRTWQRVLSIPTTAIYGEPVRQIQAVDGERAWVVTLTEPCATPTLPTYLVCPDELRRTTDGGRTWKVLVRGDIAAIRFATASRGWMAIVEPNGTVDVRVTNDGGVTWKTGLKTTSGAVVSLVAATSLTAWLMTTSSTQDCVMSSCTQYELFRTVDGGATWSSLGNPQRFTAGCSAGFLAGSLFASTTRGWLALNQGDGGAEGTGGLLETSDGGATWQCAGSPQNTSLLSAADPLHVWTTSDQGGPGGMTLYASNDGGNSWSALHLRSAG